MPEPGHAAQGLPVHDEAPSVVVLHVQADATARAQVQAKLHASKAGPFEFHDAADLTSAVAALARRRYDVVLVALVLPGAQGPAILRSLVAAGCKAPIVALTGDLDPQRGLDAVQAGAADFVTQAVTDPATFADRIVAAARGGPASAPKATLETLVKQRTTALNATLRQLEEANRDLQSQKELMSQFMDNVPVCCFVQHRFSAQLNFVSKAYETIFGRSIQALANNPMDWAEALHPDDRDAAVQAYADSMQEDGQREADFRLARPDGTRWVRVTWMSTRPDSQVYRVGIMKDVTLERQVQEATAKSMQQAAKLAVAQETAMFKSQFLNMAAHDLATPITPLRLQVAILRARAQAGGDETTLAAVTMLDRNLARLTNLIHDVLDVARIESNRIAMNAAPMDLADVVRECVATLQPQADAGEVLLHADLPPTPLTADTDRLSQIVVNLLSNAVKFTPPGGRVQVTLRPTVGEAILTVTDSGRGIAPSDLARLFEPFTRVGDTNKVPGTGLGLYISRNLAQRMGGDVKAESPGEGHGATFTLTVPLAPPLPTLGGPGAVA